MTNSFDSDAALTRILELLPIAGGSGQEGDVASYIREALLHAGLPAEALRDDGANSRSPFGGEIGNLIVDLPGQGELAEAPRVMASAHLDTVPLCVGCQPERRGQCIYPAGDTALGADNRSGCAALLTLACELLERQLSHPPLTLCFFVQEEIGLVGSRHADSELFGDPAWCVNVDGGLPGELTHGAIGGVKWQLAIRGVAAHAGSHPEDGVSAAAVFALGMHELVTTGWHGAITQAGGSGRANVGVLSGGKGTNVVMERLQVTGECRSHDPVFLEQIVGRYKEVFERTATAVTNQAGTTATCCFEEQNRYPSFFIEQESPVVRGLAESLQRLQLEPSYKISNGGQDANCLNQLHSIPTVTIGAGAHCLHTVQEYLEVDEYVAACRLLLAHVTAGNQQG